MANNLTTTNKKPINFFGNKKIFFGISLAIVLIGIVCNFIFGTTLDIQFSGGTMLTYTYAGEVNTNELKDMIQEATPDNIVTFSESQDLVNGTNKITVQFSGTTTITTDVQEQLTSDIQEAFPDNKFTLEESSSVDATMGMSFLWKCICAVALASILMVLYVTLRFKKIGGLSAGMFGLVALFHDVIVIYFFYVIFQKPIDSNFIAVALMILGYSLNDTVVIYDRIREERRLMGYKADLIDVFNNSMTKVIRRTIMTTVTTLIAVVTVYVVALVFSLDSVTGFALPMMVGLISGCYSSICIAGPLWVMWQKRKERLADTKKK